MCACKGSGLLTIYIILVASDQAEVALKKYPLFILSKVKNSRPHLHTLKVDEPQQVLYDNDSSSDQAGALFSVYHLMYSHRLVNRYNFVAHGTKPHIHDSINSQPNNNSTHFPNTIKSSSSIQVLTYQHQIKRHTKYRRRWKSSSKQNIKHNKNNNEKKKKTIIKFKIKITLWTWQFISKQKV